MVNLIQPSLSETHSPQLKEAQDDRDIAVLTVFQSEPSETELAIAEPASLYLQQSVAHCEEGDWDAGFAAAEKASSLLEDHVEIAYFLMGQSLQGQEKLEAAMEKYLQALALEPAFAEAQWAMADLFNEQGQLEEALAYYQKVVEVEADNWLIHHQMGALLNQMAQWELAKRSLLQAVALKPDSPWSYHDLGYAATNLQEWQEAARFFQTAIELDPAEVASYCGLAEVWVELENWAEAIAVYQQALELQPKLGWINEKVEAILQRRDGNKPAEDQNGIAEVVTDINIENIDVADTAIGTSIDTSITLLETEPEIALIAQAAAVEDMPKRSPDPQKTEALIRRVRSKRWANLVIPAVGKTSYDAWMLQNSPTTEALQTMNRAIAAFRYQPVISIIVPTYNPPEEFLRDAIESVIGQVYPHWELCIADDASTQPHVQAVLQEYADLDARIKVVLREKNGHISAASNAALELATGEYVALLDHDDALTPDALYEVVLLLNQHPEADMIYTDEDKIDQHNHRKEPFFKTDWCPDSFLSRMYVCHMGVYRRSIVSEMGGFRLGMEGSQDYDLVLRFTEKTNQIYHLPKVLYNWRIHEGSVAGGAEAKPYAYEAAKRALGEALQRRGEPGEVLDIPDHMGHYSIRYSIQEYKKVSIIIPTRDLADVLDTCLLSIFSKSTYPNFEVVVVDNGSVEEDTARLFAKWSRWESKRFRHYPLNIPFNYSQLNNYGAHEATGEFFLFLNNDTEVISPDWIEALVEQAQRPSVGAVGALLLYPDDTIQHAGVIMGLGGMAAHGHHNFPADTTGYAGQVICTSNVSAVTGACLMCRKEVFDAAGGFDAGLAVAYNDVDLCLKIVNAGYRNVYVPHAKLYHYESKSRGYEDTPEKKARQQREADVIRERWQNFLDHDPCYSPNLTRDRADYSIKLVGRKIEVMRVTPTEPIPEALTLYSLDAPQVGLRTYPGSLKVDGWVIGRRGRAIAVDVVCNGQTFGASLVNRTRPDVAAAHPDSPAAKVSGFLIELDAATLPSQAELLVYVRMDNQQRVLMGSIQLICE
jgi:O-antigen biosynthesis protein